MLTTLALVATLAAGRAYGKTVFKTVVHDLGNVPQFVGTGPNLRYHDHTPAWEENSIIVSLPCLSCPLLVEGDGYFKPSEPNDLLFNISLSEDRTTVLANGFTFYPHPGSHLRDAFLAMQVPRKISSMYRYNLLRASPEDQWSDRTLPHEKLIFSYSHGFLQPRLCDLQGHDDLCIMLTVGSINLGDIVHMHPLRDPEQTHMRIAVRRGQSKQLILDHVKLATRRDLDRNSHINLSKTTVVEASDSAKAGSTSSWLQAFRGLGSAITHNFRKAGAIILHAGRSIGLRTVSHWMLALLVLIPIVPVCVAIRMSRRHNYAEHDDEEVASPIYRDDDDDEDVPLSLVREKILKANDFV